MRIEICCEEMTNMLKREQVWINLHVEILLDFEDEDGQYIEINYCPFCGKKIEIIKPEK